MQYDLFKLPEEDLSELETKVCRLCGEEKPLSEYYSHPHYTGNIFKYCRSCHIERTSTAYYLKKTAPPQNGRCDCCGRLEQKLMLDHDHNTKEFRGWLCRSCNTGIGSLGDDIEGLEQAIKYLRRRNASI